jgi:hypothetical protein
MWLAGHGVIALRPAGYTFNLLVTVEECAGNEELVLRVPQQEIRKLHFLRLAMDTEISKL